MHHARVVCCMREVYVHAASQPHTTNTNINMAANGTLARDDRDRGGFLCQHRAPALHVVFCFASSVISHVADC